MYDLANFVIDARWYSNVAFYPGHVHDDRDFDGREEAFVEMTLLRVIPGETFILENHEMV